MASQKWSLDYTQRTASSSASVVDPPGYVASLTKSSTKNATALIKPTDLSGLRQQKAWEVALAPAKNVPMQAFMMYMTGGGVQIFSVMSVWFLLKGAVSGILSVEQVFAPYASKSPSTTSPSTSGSSSTTTTTTPTSLLNQKAVFVACQIGLLLVGLWKCNSMGLLPTHESDWLAFREPIRWET